MFRRCTLMTKARLALAAIALLFIGFATVAPASAASLIYDSFWDDVFRGNITASSDTFKGMLVTSSYTADKAHDKRDDITNEVSGTGYTAGGATVTVTVNLATSGNSHIESLTFSSPAWTTSTITARGLVLYKSRGGASSADNLVQYVDFGSNITSTAGTFTATIGALSLQN